MGFSTLAALEVRPCSASDIGEEVYSTWDCLIDEHFVYVALQEATNMLPGYPVYWRVTIYQSKAQGVYKAFNNLEDAKATYKALVTSKIPAPRTLVDVWGFEWNF